MADQPSLQAPEQHVTGKYLLGVILLTSVLLCGTELGVRYSLHEEAYLKTWKAEHHDKAYNVALVGNSIAYVNINIPKLEVALQENILDVTAGGSGSAWWYAAMKNMVANRLEKQPTWVLVPFRDFDLTTPDFTGGYRETDLLRVSELHEPLLDEKVWEEKKGILFPLFAQIKIFRHREFWKSAVYDMAKLHAGFVFGLDKNELGESISTLLNVGKQVGVLPSTTKEKNFRLALKSSLLPDILALAKEHKWQLVMIRQRTRNYAKNPTEKPGTQKYMNALEMYLQKNDVIFLDYSKLEMLSERDFRDMNHLYPEARDRFTDRLAIDLKSILSARR